MRYQDIKWEDDDKSSTHTPQLSNPEDTGDISFAQLLKEDNSPLQELELRVGMRVSGTISALSAHSDTVLIELSPHLTGVMDKNNICDSEGQLTHHVGDTIQAYVVSYGGDEIQLSMRMAQSKVALDDLRTARSNELPVKGKVTGENKGGFDVTIMGKRCFCPVSQMDSKALSNKAEYIGREFNFLIEKIEEGGRNIVVSRTKLLRREAAAKIQDLESRIDQELILDGIVSDVRDFGAFVDLGGFQGFLHVSELSYARVSRASDFLQKGDSIRVKVMKIETAADGKKRISLSMEAIQDDPWATIGEKYSIGATYTGHVSRLESFGAFVSLEPGIEGLLHVSEMSWERRVHHPNEILKVGDTVQVRILDLQVPTQKISLSLKHIEQDPWLHAATSFPVQARVTGTVQSLKGFGAFVELAPGLVGLLPLEILKKAYGESYKKKASPPQTIEVVIRELDPQQRRILLSLPDLADDADDMQAYRDYIQSQAQSPQSKKAASPPQGSFGAILAASLAKKKT